MSEGFMGEDDVDIIRTHDAMRARVDAWRASGLRVGLVPTMGSLHAGHVSLIAQARKHCDRVVVSIFVNPTQFGANEDFNSYPRDEARDIGILADAGVDVLYAPSVDQMYPNGTETDLRAGDIGQLWEGAHRAGHFDGVATVVARLFAHCPAIEAYFGEKDYQQLQVIRAMVKAQALKIKIISVETKRESDGLALSSRNVYLDIDERTKAPNLYRVMGYVARRVMAGDNPRELEAWAVQELQDAGFSSVDYVAVVDAQTLAPINADDVDTRPVRVLAAATLGRTRLIDNMAVR